MSKPIKTWSQGDRHVEYKDFDCSVLFFMLAPIIQNIKRLSDAGDFEQVKPLISEASVIADNGLKTQVEPA